jgi:putative transposase
MERFFCSLKTEWGHYQNRIEAKNDIVAYIEMFYNSNRLHSYLNYLSPQNFERFWGEVTELKKVSVFT